MILNKYHKPFKDVSNYILNLYLQALIIFLIIKPVKGERRLKVDLEVLERRLQKPLDIQGKLTHLPHSLHRTMSSVTVTAVRHCTIAMRQPKG